MGKGQTRLWKFLFTASSLAVWSRSQQLLKWNKPRSRRLILFLFNACCLTQTLLNRRVFKMCLCTLWESQHTNSGYQPGVAIITVTNSPAVAGAEEFSHPPSDMVQKDPEPHSLHSLPCRKYPTAQTGLYNNSPTSGSTFTSSWYTWHLQTYRIHLTVQEGWGLGERRPLGWWMPVGGCYATRWKCPLISPTSSTAVAFPLPAYSKQPDWFLIGLPARR